MYKNNSKSNFYCRERSGLNSTYYIYIYVFIRLKKKKKKKMKYTPLQYKLSYFYHGAFLSFNLWMVYCLYVSSYALANNRIMTHVTCFIGLTIHNNFPDPDFFWLYSCHVTVLIFILYSGGHHEICLSSSLFIYAISVTNWTIPVCIFTPLQWYYYRFD